MGASPLLHLDASCTDTLSQTKWQDLRENLRSTRYVAGKPRSVQDSASRRLVDLSGEALLGSPALNNVLNFGKDAGVYSGFTVSIVFKVLDTAEYGQTIIGVGNGGSTGTDWRLWVTGANAQRTYNVEAWTMMFGTGRAGTDHWQPHFDMPCPNEMVVLSASLSQDGHKLVYINGVLMLHTQCSMSDKGTGTNSAAFNIGGFSGLTSQLPPAHFAEVRVYNTAFQPESHDLEQSLLLRKWAVPPYSGSVHQARTSHASCQSQGDLRPAASTANIIHKASILCLLLVAFAQRHGMAA